MIERGPHAQTVSAGLRQVASSLFKQSFLIWNGCLEQEKCEGDKYHCSLRLPVQRAVVFVPRQQVFLALDLQGTDKIGRQHLICLRIVLFDPTGITQGCQDRVNR